MVDRTEWNRLSQRLQPLVLMKQALELLDQQDEPHSARYLHTAILTYETWLAEDADRP